MVVNDSLVMVDFVNRARERGLSVIKALRESGVARFRPIILTSLTTFAGLTPLLLEKSLQAKFLIPMAVSLGFGVIFSTFITLILVPVGISYWRISTACSREPSSTSKTMVWKNSTVANGHSKWAASSSRYVT